MQAHLRGPVKGYLEELEGGVSNTETFVAIKAEINNWRFGRRSLLHQTGKRLTTRMSEIVITFKPIPHNIFEKRCSRITANQLIIRLQPDEGVKQSLMIKDPGPGGMRLRNVSLDIELCRGVQCRIRMPMSVF